MKLNNTMFLWRPVYWDKERGGDLQIVSRKWYINSYPHPPEEKKDFPLWNAYDNWPNHFAKSGKYAFTEHTAMMKMYQFFNILVVRDGIDPKKAHDEFMKIDEYREHCPVDMPADSTGELKPLPGDMFVSGC